MTKYLLLMIKGSICKKNRIMSVMPNLSKTDSLGLQLVCPTIPNPSVFDILGKRLKNQLFLQIAPLRSNHETSCHSITDENTFFCFHMNIVTLYEKSDLAVFVPFPYIIIYVAPWIFIATGED